MKVLVKKIDYAFDSVEVIEVDIDDSVLRLMEEPPPTRVLKLGKPHCWLSKDGETLNYLVYLGGDKWIYWNLYEDLFFPEEADFIIKNQKDQWQLSKELLNKKKERGLE